MKQAQNYLILFPLNGDFEINSILNEEKKMNDLIKLNYSEQLCQIQDININNKKNPVHHKLHRIFI